MENAMPRSCGENQKVVNLCLQVQRVSIRVCVVLYDIWLSLCGLFDVEALGCNVFLMHNKSCGEAQPNFRSLSFLRWPSNASS